MLRYPIPLILAALVATTAVMVYLTLDVRPVVPVVDENFTGTLFKGSVYLWRGAAGSLTFYTDGGDIEVSYFVPTYVVYLNGPPGNVTIREGLLMASSPTTGPWLLHKVWVDTGAYMIRAGLLFKLEPVEVGDNLTVYVPIYAVPGNDYQDVYELFEQAHGETVNLNIIYNIQVNSTHVIIKPVDATGELTGKLFYPIADVVRISDGDAYTYHFSGVGFSYKIGNRTISGFAMPYAHFIIKPLADTTVTITVG